MESAAHKLMEVRGITKHFRLGGQTIRVLKGVDLDVAQGEMVAIMGASGVGKSTLLHVLGTLDAPSSGTIRLNGQDLSRLSGRRLAEFRNRHLGFVFQFHHLLPEFTALENAMMPGLVARMARDEIESRATRALDEVGLSHRLEHRPGELSGGEQQRVALARALVLEPNLLMADEPTGNLDSQMSEEIHQLFFQINERHETTMIIVTHNAELAARMPRQLRMVDGIIVEEKAERELGAQSEPDGAAAPETDLAGETAASAPASPITDDDRAREDGETVPASAGKEPTRDGQGGEGV